MAALAFWPGSFSSAHPSCRARLLGFYSRRLDAVRAFLYLSELAVYPFQALLDRRDVLLYRWFRLLMVRNHVEVCFRLLELRAY